MRTGGREHTHRALVAGVSSDVVRRQEALPDPGPGQVRVHVAYTAISPGSDLHVDLAGAYGPSGEGVPQELLDMGNDHGVNA